MPKFDTRLVREIKAREVVEELFVDNIGQLQIFENQLTGTTYECELADMLIFIQHFANGGSPGKKVKYLKNPIPGGTEFEFISKHLRLYAIQRPGKKIIVFGGTKKAADSSDNIKTFRLLKERYIESLKQAK